MSRPSIANNIRLRDKQANGARKAREAIRRPRYPGIYGERDYGPAESEFLTAAEAYRSESKRPFLDATDYFRVLLALGYRKVADGDGDPAGG